MTIRQIIKLVYLAFGALLSGSILPVAGMSAWILAPWGTWASMATIGLVPLILMLITRTASISIAQMPTHPSTALVGIASLCVVSRVTRSGAADYNINTFRAIGEHHNCWSKTSFTIKEYSSHFNFNNINVYPSHASSHKSGLVMRCLANYP